MSSRQSVVSGKVRIETGNGMPGVNVIVETTTTGATNDGDYSITVTDEDATLTFSFIGYGTKKSHREYALGEFRCSSSDDGKYPCRS